MCVNKRILAALNVPGAFAGKVTNSANLGLTWKGSGRRFDPLRPCRGTLLAHSPGVPREEGWKGVRLQWIFNRTTRYQSQPCMLPIAIGKEQKTTVNGDLLFCSVSDIRDPSL